jgi:hypothetical protein
MGDRMKIFITQNVWADTYDIHILEEGYNGKRYMAEPMELKFKEYVEGNIEPPTLKISRVFGRETNFLQAFSDALAKCGYKPKSVEENKGELKATKYHLEDMRKLLLKGASPR